MAKALVLGVRGSTPTMPGPTELIATCYFTGSDVLAAIEGHPQTVTVRLAAGFTLADLKTALVAAAQARSTELGLTVVSTDVDLLSFDSGV